jgi:hypothetical protein
MNNELIAEAVADSKKVSPEPKLFIRPIAFFVFLALLCGLIALAAYNLTHSVAPELLWNAITVPTN